MNPRIFAPTALRLCAALGLLSLTHASAQTRPGATPPATSPGAAAPTNAKKEDTIQLSAFEVRAETDHSYGALDSNSLAAFRMELAKAPATAEVFTQAFMDDIAATSIEEVLTGYSGTVTAASNNPNAGLDAPGDRDGSQGLSIRGVSAGEIKRDGLSACPTHRVPPLAIRTALRLSGWISSPARSRCFTARSVVAA